MKYINSKKLKHFIHVKYYLFIVFKKINTKKNKFEMEYICYVDDIMDTNNDANTIYAEEGKKREACMTTKALCLLHVYG